MRNKSALNICFYGGFLKFFRQSATSIIGLDIGTHSIKLVELGGSLASPKVIAWGLIKTPANAFAENAITNVDLLADAVRNLMVQAGASSQTAAVAISSSHAITKIIGMPADISELELEEQVNIEALHFVPYPIDEVNIDFEVIGRSASNERENDVLLVACRRTIVDEYIDLVEAADLQLKYVDIDTYALERVCRGQKRLTGEAEGPIAVFDIGTNTSHLMLLDKQRVIYSRHQNFGGSQLIKQIRKEYGVSAEEAEGILNSAQLPADFIAAVQEPFAEQLQQEISRALQFFYSSSPHSSIDNLVLSGGCASLEGVAGDLEMKLRTKVSVLNPFASARVMSSRGAVARHSSSMATAYGLALRGLS